MKKIIYLVFIFILFVSLNACKCKQGQNGGNTTENTKNNKDKKGDKSFTEKTQYVKEWGIWCYKNKDDIGKKANEVKDKIYLYFGEEVSVANIVKINNKEYYELKIAGENDTYWANSDVFAEKFIVINKPSTKCYNRPNDTSISPIKLEAGDFGYFLREEGDFIEVDFYAYRPSTPDGEKKWVGTKWIKDGYTTNLIAAKEAYYLYFSYYHEIKNNIDKAVNMLEKSLQVSETYEQQTEITPIIQSRYEELTGHSYNTSNKTDDNTEAPDTDME